jgi:hypothetical protein
VILASPPVNTVAPSLSGTAQDGKALTVAKGTWTGVATITYSYQWQLTTDGGATWNDIPGATTTSYTPPAGSAGKQVRAIVTATNGDGTAAAASPASAVILANPPVNTVAPSLTGTAQDGVALTAAKGTWTGMATITYTYQWQASTDGGLTWNDIPAATSSSYTPPAGSAGKQLHTIVTATNGDGNTQATTPASAPILPNPPLNTVAPTLTGTAQDGVALSTGTGTWTGMATITYAYQWQISTDGGATWSDIVGATGTGYTPPAGTAGKQVRALVTGTNPDGSVQAASAASQPILPSPPVNVVAPSLSGVAQDGTAIDTDSGVWSGPGTITIGYQWQLSSDGGSTWSDIAGANGTSYTPPAGSAGSQVRAVVTAANPDGTTQASSAASAVIVAAPPANTVVPSLIGIAQTGSTLTSSTGTWSGIAPITFAYQWQVSVDGGVTWADVAGATASSFLLRGLFLGKQVRVEVTATNGDGSSQARSTASAVIVSPPAPPSPPTPPAATPSIPQSPAPDTGSGVQPAAPASITPPPRQLPTKPKTKAKAPKKKTSHKPKPKRKPKKSRPHRSGWSLVDRSGH